MKHLPKIAVVAILATVALGALTSSCSKEIESNADDSAPEMIVGTTDYVFSLTSLVNEGIFTKGGSMTEEDAERLMPYIIDYSKDYLQENGLDIKDCFEGQDERYIAICGIALADYDRTYGLSTRSRASSCVLDAIGIGHLAEDGAKAIAKKLAKAVLKKAVPYVGAAVTIVDFISCMNE